MGQLNLRGSRRTLLTGAAALASAGALAGCTVQMEGVWQQHPPHPILPSPTSSELAGAATPAPRQLGLEEFLALSSVLTGFDDLNPALGTVYLQSLQQRSDPAVTLTELYDRLGFGGPSGPQTAEALEAAGVFEREEMSALADMIITYWYTGIYDKDGEQAVATYVDALVWQAVGYLKPRTICGPFPGFWRERPPTIP